MTRPDLDHPETGQGKPFWFGPQACRMLGWYHAPVGLARACAVVLCPPFGHEYLVSYRAYRKLAEMLAQAGFACLYFDYDGTGDSAASSLPRVSAWRSSVVAAVTEIRTLSGQGDVALFGVRLGALLAASVVQETSANALVMGAPTISGRGFVREQVSFSRMSPLTTADDRRLRLSDEEVAGYPIIQQTQQDLAALDMQKMDMPCPVLILDRDDMPGQASKVVSAWQAQGREVQTSQVQGYAAMMTKDSYSSTPPMAMWGEVCQWLTARYESRAFSPATPDEMPISMRADQRYIEEVIVFNGLVGVITSPSGCLPRKAGVVLTNIGASHRVGNHLLYVHLARSLAELGYCVMRFDRAGTGYSRPTPEGTENDVYAKSGIDDVRQAIDCLQERCPCTRIVLAGLCSGAYFSYKAALVDPRVLGLILINLPSFQWRDGDSLETRQSESINATDFYLQSLRSKRTWIRMVKGQVAIFLILKVLAARLLTKLYRTLESIASMLVGDGEGGSVVVQNFRHLLHRKAKILFVFSANDVSRDVVAAELGRDACNLKSPRRVQVENIHGTDHTFTPLWAQAHLQALVCAFLQRRFP